MRKVVVVAVVVVVVVVAAVACSPPPAPPRPIAKAPILDADQRRVFRPLPARFGTAGTPSEIALGKALFFDRRWSARGDVSCQSCHILAHGGDDDSAVSTGTHGQRGLRNAPTVLNAAGHFRYFWDGRAGDLVEQARGPLLNPLEHGFVDDDAVVKTLSTVPGYAPLFASAFGDPAITVARAGAALAAFERELRTPARYDRWAAGDDAALDDDEQRGALTFMATGCLSCHNGPLFGGNSFQKAGAVKPWFSDKDRGRVVVTGAAADEFVFKVPSLRNVTETAPYFHDGSVDDLNEAVRRMARHQLGKELDDDDVTSIVRFLGALRGDLDPSLLEAPALP